MRIRFKQHYLSNFVGIGILAALGFAIFTIPEKNSANSTTQYSAGQFRSETTTAHGSKATPAKGVRVNRVRSVYDGDTIRVDIDGWPQIIGKNMPVRILRVDTPEIQGKCQAEKEKAKQARNFLYSSLKNGKIVELRNIQRGKYFRILSDVYIDGVRISDELIKNGLARAYNGGKRKTWC